MIGRIGLYILLITIIWSPATEAQIIADMSQGRVNVDVGFQGQEVLIFGSIDQGDDIYIDVLGPRRPISVRGYQRWWGLWWPKPADIYDHIPAFFYRAQTEGPTVDKHDDLAVIARWAPQADANIQRSIYHDMLGRNVWQRGFVRVKQDRLFRAFLTLPPQAPSGEYLVEVRVYQAEVLVSNKVLYMDVAPVGLRHWIDILAWGLGPAYGILAVLMAVMMGGVAALLWRNY